MGSFTVTSENVFTQSAEDIYDFISNPHNWPKTYRGSAGIASTVRTPLAVGDTWTETVKVGDFVCVSTWTLLTAVRPRKFEFRQIDAIGARADGTGGVDGFTTITYTLTPAIGGQTLFTRTLHCELPHGVRIPDELLVARAQPAGIDGYHEAVARLLAEATAEKTTGTSD